MKMKTVLVIAFLALGVFAKAQTAKEIVQKSIDQAQGKSSYGEMEMTIVRPTWTRKISMKTWTYGTKYSLIRITDPARDQGTGFLKRDNEIWNWQPNIRRTIKMPPSMMSQSWMGSDFTNDDLVKQSSMVEDYTHEKIGEATIEGRESFVILLTPKPNAPVVWGKVKLWISKEHYLQMKAEYYDEDGELVHTLYGKDVKEMGGRLLPSILEVVPADEPDQKTVVKQSNMKFDIGISPDFFSIQNLKNAN